MSEKTYILKQNANSRGNSATGNNYTLNSLLRVNLLTADIQSNTFILSLLEKRRKFPFAHAAVGGDVQPSSFRKPTGGRLGNLPAFYISISFIEILENRK
jgi:hypothetical protein